MSLVKKIKDILFEEEEEYTEPIKIKEDVVEFNAEPKIVKIEPEKEVKIEQKEELIEVPKEKETPKIDNSFRFPDFDEEEFVSNMQRSRQNSNVLEYEKKKNIEKRNEFTRYERVEKETIDKKKFKPSPIISPVYGILNQDYKAEDIVNRNEVASTINIDEVRRKAFEPKIVEEKKVMEKEVIDEPVVTFFEDKDNSIPESKDYKSIDDLLEEASSEISLEDTLEMPKTNNLDTIEEELEKIDVKENDEKKADAISDDDLDNDLFELIDSMYDDREEV